MTLSKTIKKEDFDYLEESVLSSCLNTKAHCHITLAIVVNVISKYVYYAVYTGGPEYRTDNIDDAITKYNECVWAPRSEFQHKAAVIHFAGNSILGEEE